MYQKRKKSQIINKIELNQEENSKLQAAQEEIEFLRELIDSQNQRIYNLENELQEVHQEIEVINDQLAKAIMSGVSFDEAKAIAKKILNDEKGIKETVARLLSMIYNMPVEAEKFREKEKFNIQTSEINSQLANKIRLQSQKLRNHSK
jgi:arginine deiminase